MFSIWSELHDSNIDGIHERGIDIAAFPLLCSVCKASSKGNWRNETSPPSWCIPGNPLGPNSRNFLGRTKSQYSVTGFKDPLVLRNLLFWLVALLGILREDNAMSSQTAVYHRICSCRNKVLLLADNSSLLIHKGLYSFRRRLLWDSCVRAFFCSFYWFSESYKRKQELTPQKDSKGKIKSFLIFNLVKLYRSYKSLWTC